jgi:hypothetical protein
MKLIYIYILLFHLIFFQTNYSKNLFLQLNNLIYDNGKQKIELENFNNQKYLFRGRVEKIKVKSKNVRTEKLSFSGQGLSFFKNTPNELILNIDLNNKDIMKLKHYVLVVYYIHEDIEFIYKFSIPLKDR